ncbi:MAG: tetratricopeptide repeat protein [Betaproteobacteria bacterium]|nr:tetratricopeptide repeat protein [Betaproteobacteria bacterium]
MAGKPVERNLPSLTLTEPILYELLIAEIAAQRGSVGLAAQAYADLARKTRDPRIARRATELAGFARLPNLALESAKVWNETEPASIQALQTVTGLLIGARRVAEAEPYLDKLLRASSTSLADGFLQLNRVLASNSDRAANLEVVRKLAARHVELPQARFAVAQAAAVAGDESLALAEIRKAAELKPDWEAPALFEAQVLQRRSPAEAQARLAGFLDKYPQARDVRLSYARLLLLDRKPVESRAQLQTLVSAHPGSADVHYSAGLLAAQAKDYDAAEGWMKRALELGMREPNGVRYTLGQIAEERKDTQGALQWYGQVQSGDQYLPARMRYANILAKQGKLEEARSFLRASNAGGQQQVQLLIGEAQLLREANLHAEAFKLLGQALEEQPDQPELLYDHALTAEKLDRFDILEANLQKLIKARPDHAHAHNALGYSLADRNLRLDEAKKLIERALELSPDDSFIVDSLGWVYFRMGDNAKALEYLRRAYEARPDGEIGAHLGEVLWAAGERAEAERVWQEALKNHPENETLQKTIKRLKP